MTEEKSLSKRMMTQRKIGSKGEEEQTCMYCRENLNVKYYFNNYYIYISTCTLTRLTE